MSTERHPSRLPWIILAILVVATLVVVGFAVARSISGPAPVARSTSTTDAIPPASSPTTDRPTGCIAGNGYGVAMLRTAQSSAEQSSDGAVEFAAAFVRWAYQSPKPSKADAASATKFALATDASESTFSALLADAPPVDGVTPPAGTDYRRSTAPGVWVAETFTGDTAIVDIGTSVAIGGRVRQAERGAITVTLAWDDSGWSVVSLSSEIGVIALYQVGERFSAGC